MRVYLAGPFFNAGQLVVIQNLEALICETPGLTLFSPRSFGVIEHLTPEQKAEASKKIFVSNCEEMDKADVIFAVIDGRDTGTTWELGYAFAKGKIIVTYTDSDYGLNVMIRECVQAHCHGLKEAKKVLEALGTSNYATIHEAFKRHRRFHPGIV